ncbi:hypothetical protein RHGRI_002078 [Rhododendron griersonianum]|uniref:F-box domain-containing protein n=1 Tax=Rhododendron griersonianum TaxID=479676 RepID=A0AAV6LNH1_9ERIC|nr:hypothetical protein RHGRI_002078 [Rhododendron griersonianum]
MAPAPVGGSSPTPPPPLRSIDSPSSKSSVGAECSSVFDFVCDELLVEIFCRLPPKQVYGCKSVSKRWLKLISTNRVIVSSLLYRRRQLLLPTFDALPIRTGPNRYVPF